MQAGFSSCVSSGIIVGRGQYRNAVASGRTYEATRRYRVTVLTSSKCGRLHVSIFYKLKLQSHTAIGTVEERPKLSTGDIVLHVAGIPVIRDVEDCESRASLVLFPAKTDLECFHHENVER